MKKILKFIILGIFFILVLPCGLAAKLFYIITKQSHIFDFFAQLFALIPGIPGTLVRASFYKQTLAEAHLNLDIGFCSFVTKIESKIGSMVLITGHSQIGLVEIGDNAVIANYVSILSGRYQHNFSDSAQKITDEAEDAFQRIKIGTSSFIGDHSTVMADVGEFSIVGAASNVVKPIPPYVVAVGNPAKVVKERPQGTSPSKTD